MSCTAAPPSLWMSYCHNAFAKIQRRKEITKKMGEKIYFPYLYHHLAAASRVAWIWATTVL